MGSFIDQLVTAGSIDFIYTYFLLFVSISLSTLILGYISGYIYVKLQTQAGYDLNSDIIKRLQKVSLSFTQGQDTAYLNQRINNDSNGLIIFCVSIIQSIVVNIFMIIVPLFLLFRFNITLSIVLLFVVIIYFVCYMLYKKRLYKVSFDFKEAQASFFGKLNEQLFNIKFIKLHGLFERFFARLDNNFIILLSKALRFQKTNYVFSGLDKIIMMIAQMTMLFIGGIEVIRGRLSIGEFTIISSYFSMLLSAIRYFFTLGQNIQDTLVSYNRLNEIQSVSEEWNGSKTLEYINKIEMCNVSFCYGEKIVLNNVNACFMKGQTYAIVGPNGSGKSSFIDVLLGLHIGNLSGDVLYNEMSMSDIDMYSLREHLIRVSEQEPMLMADTLTYNLTFGEISCINKKKMDELIDILNLNTYLTLLPDGLDSNINEKASNLSGGEKQKLSILRTLLREPDVIVLDEPTSALDALSRIRLSAYLDKLKKDKIIIIITHDKDFADKCDVLIHMNLG